MGSSGSPWRCFTVSGEIGSGKSSVARRLASETGADFHSTGGLQRRLASGRNLSTLEMNLLSETEPTIDEQIDGFTRELAATGGQFVIDSRLAWHFVPEALKVFLLVDPGQAVHRVLGDQPNRTESERYGGSEEAVRDIRARQESERRRFLSTYGVDLFRWSNYDLVIDTSEISADRTVELILSHRDEEGSSVWFWLAPKSIYPTRRAGELVDSEIDTLLETMREEGFDRRTPIGIIAARDRGLYALDGHRRLSCALRLGLPIVPCRLVGQGGDEVAPDLTVTAFLADRPKPGWIREWEEAHGFQFTSHPGEWE